MTPVQNTYALCAALAGLTLGVLNIFVWRKQRFRWALLLGVAFLMLGTMYVFDGQLQPTETDVNALFGWGVCTAVLLTTFGLSHYTGMGRYSDRWALVLGVSALLLVALAFGAQPLTRRSGFIILSLLMMTQAVLLLAAMLRRPGEGYGYMVLALLTYPLCLVAGLAGWIDLTTMRYLVMLPLSLMGMSVLTIGLLRAHREAQTELDRRQRAEQALRTLNGDLERRVKERTEELHDMVLTLESFNRTVSHDLRGPLGGIAGVSRLAAEAVERGDRATAIRLLRAITQQAENSAELVASLLVLAKVGGGELHCVDTALDPLVRDIVAELKRSDASLERVQIVVGDLPRMSVDPTLVRQVFVNLIGNAAKFAKDLPQPRIDIGCHEEAGATVLSVRDNGVGFDSAGADRLFQPFLRLHGTQFQGHGVGLSIVKRIVDRHGGRIWARSVPGQGANFYFSLSRSALPPA